MDVYQTVGKESTSPGFVAGYVKGELEKGGVKDVVGVYETRVRGRSVLLANPRKESRVGEARRAAKERRRVERTRGGVEKGLVRGETCSYSSVVGLHQMWRGLDTGLEGALIRGELRCPDRALLIFPTVVSSANPALVGLSGIVVLELAKVLQIVTIDDKIKSTSDPIRSP